MNINYVTPQDYGAAGNGIADDTQAFKDAIEYCSAYGWDLYVPTSRGEKYLITDTLRIRGNGLMKRVFGDVAFRFGSVNSMGGLIWDISSGSGNTGLDIDQLPPLFLNEVEGLSVSGLNIMTSSNGMEGLFIKNLCTKYSGSGPQATVSHYTTDVDASITNCRIDGFRFGFLHYGRGLKVTDCSISNVRYVFDIRYFPNPELSWASLYSEANSNHPLKYNQRGINISNNRVHAFTSRFLLTRTYTFDSDHTDCAPYAYGMRICNNFFDNGRGIFIIAQATAYNWLICNNTLNGIEISHDDYLINFKEGAKDTIVSGNSVHGALDYWTDGDYDGIGAFIRCAGSENCSFSNNSIDCVHYCFVVFGENKNLSVIGNTAQNVYKRFFMTVSVATGRSFDGLILTNNNVSFSTLYTNSPVFLYQPSPTSETVTCSNSYDEHNTWRNGYKSQRSGDWVFVHPVVNYTGSLAALAYGLSEATEAEWIQAEEDLERERIREEEEAEYRRENELGLEINKSNNL